MLGKQFLIYLFDLLIVSLNYFFVFALINNFHQFYLFDFFPTQEIVQGTQSIQSYRPIFVLIVLIWGVLLWFEGGYEHLRLQPYRRAFQISIFNGFLFIAILASLAFILKLTFLSRLFIFMYTITSVLWLALTRCSILWVGKKAMERGYNIKNLIVVGTGRRAQRFLSLIAKHTEWGYRVIGLLDKDVFKNEIVAGYPVLGKIEDLPRILELHVVDEVVVIVPRNWFDEINDLIHYCEAIGLPATLAADLFDLEIASSRSKQFDGIDCLTFETRLLKGSELFLKRAFDIIVSFSILMLSAPLFILIAFLIKFTSPGPVFFNQIRVGRNGRKFKLYKFRSMVIDAEKQLEKLLDQNEVSGPVFKIENDPRVTKIGKILRKTSLDEFPQFWNVLTGDMSIVGPRPPLPSEVEQYEPWQRRRLSMKPGITCIWQVSGRNSIPFEKWMEMDLSYIDNWSLFLDFRLVLLTMQTVIARTGY